MSNHLTRRALFDRLRGGPVQQRPPWSIREATFSERCTSCGACIDTCPEDVLAKGRGDLPIVDFTDGSCTFCGACAAACEEGCFVADLKSVPWSLRAQVSNACVEPKGVTCRMCESACADDAIRFRQQAGGASSIRIDDESCTGCGACVGSCPVAAISMTSEILEETSR